MSLIESSHPTPYVLDIFGTPATVSPPNKILPKSDSKVTISGQKSFFVTFLPFWWNPPKVSFLSLLSHSEFFGVWGAVGASRYHKSNSEKSRALFGDRISHFHATLSHLKSLYQEKASAEIREEFIRTNSRVNLAVDFLVDFFGPFIWKKQEEKIHPKMHGNFQIRIGEFRGQNPHCKDPALTTHSKRGSRRCQGPRVCKRWFPNGGSSSVGERISATPFLPKGPGRIKNITTY